MTPSEIAGWVGATTGILSLLWNIYTKLSAGPKVTGTASANMISVTAEPGNFRYFRVAVQNVGTASTTLTNVTLGTWGTRWERLVERLRLRKPPVDFHAVLANFRGSPLPFTLDAGGEWQAVMRQDAAFSDLLVKHRLYCEAWHSFSKVPTRIKIMALTKNK